MSNPSYRGPRPLSEIVGELFTVRGYGRLNARQELEDAWKAAVGELHYRQTQLGEVRRGVLKVTVAHPTLLEELAAFRKPALLIALRSGAPATTIHDIQFRVGAIAPGASPTAGSTSNRRVGRRDGEGPCSSTPVRRLKPGRKSKPGNGSSSESGPR